MTKSSVSTSSKWILFVLALVLLVYHAKSLQTTQLELTINFFSMKRLIVVCDISLQQVKSFYDTTNLVVTVLWMTNVSQVEDWYRQGEETVRNSGLIVCEEYVQSRPFKHLLEEPRTMRAASEPWVFLGSGLQVVRMVSDWNIGIHQKVYTFDTEAMEATELYLVNNHSVRESFNVPEKKLAPMALRRGDLQGADLITLVDEQPPYIELSGDQSLPHPQSSGVVVHSEALIQVNADDVHSSFKNLLLELQKELNFSVNYFLREDRVWGGKGNRSIAEDQSKFLLHCRDG